MPILIIKTSWGGKSLHTDFRPPNAGPYVFDETQLASFQKQGKDIPVIKAAKEKETGVYYRLMLDHVKKVLGDIKCVVPEYDPRRRATKSRASRGSRDGTTWWTPGTYPNRDKPGRLRCLQHGDGSLHPRCAAGFDSVRDTIAAIEASTDTPELIRIK